jgi:hypothetical protein
MQGWDSRDRKSRRVSARLHRGRRKRGSVRPSDPRVVGTHVGRTLKISKLLNKNAVFDSHSNRRLGTQSLITLGTALLRHRVTTYSFEALRPSGHFCVTMLYQMWCAAP